MKTASRELRDAIAFLGATEVAPGRFAFRRALTWYAQSLGYLESIADWVKAPCDDEECACKGGDDGLLCALSRGECVELPFWWTPDKQTAWRILDARGEEADPHARYGYAPTGLPLGYRAQAITVDFETGKEVPA